MTTPTPPTPMNDDEYCRWNPNSEEAGFGSLHTDKGDMPLRQLAVNGRITGLIYRLTVIQEFFNAYSEPLEATYIFPLPARAGVTHFKLKVQDRVIEGELQERGKAREHYDQAIRQGHRAAIAEEERPEVFTIRAGNIPPNEAVSVELELSGPLLFSDGQATFRFPLVVAPRYIPGTPLDGASVGTGTATDTDAVPDASRITPPVWLPGQPNPVHLSFDITLDPAGLPCHDVRCSLHAVRVSHSENGVMALSLDPGVERLNRDFILRFRVSKQAISSSLVYYRTPNSKEATFLLMVAPPPSRDRRPRDVVVVLDRSGSMDGWKMAAARRAAGRLIDTLTDDDRFGVILFDHHIEEPAPSTGKLVAASDRARFQAMEALARVEARGGTEMAPALTRALSYFQDSTTERERLLVFVTDGQVGNEDQLLRQVEQQAQNCRIFTIGIDRAVNGSLLERLASYGGGHCELVESENRLDEVMRSVHHRIGEPLLTDLKIDFPLKGLTPERSDLFPGVPLRLGGRTTIAHLPETVTVTAQHSDGSPFTETLTPVACNDSAIRTLWARSRVLDMEHQFAAGHLKNHLANQITEFSLRYGVLCRFTAFVAVDRSEVVNPEGQLHQVTQPVELPDKWEQPPMVAAAPIGSHIMSSRALRASIDSEETDTLDIPAFLRRQAGSSDFSARDNTSGGDDEMAEALEEPQIMQSSEPSSEASSGLRNLFSHLSPSQQDHHKKLQEALQQLRDYLANPLLESDKLFSLLNAVLKELKAIGRSVSDLHKEGKALATVYQKQQPDISEKLADWANKVQAYLDGQSDGEPDDSSKRKSWWR